MSWTDDLITTSATASRAAVATALADVDADDARRAAAPRWQPIVPLASGALRRPQAGVRLQAGPEPGTETCSFDVPHDVAVRFRTLCAMRGVDQRRILERLVRSWVILGLADPNAPAEVGLGGRPA